MTPRLFCCSLIVSLASACGGGAGSPDGGGGGDADAGLDAFATPPDDAALAPDTPRVPDAPPTLDAPERTDAAEGADARPGLDSGAAADTGCTYIDEPRIVYCVDTYEYVREWISIDGPACPPYATGTGGERYATLVEAIVGSACEDACVWRASTSVSLLRCGRRTGYIEFAAEGCDPLYETPDGIFRSIADWDAAAPCP